MTSLPIETKLIACWLVVLLMTSTTSLPITETHLLLIQCFFLITVGIFHGAYDLHYAFINQGLKTTHQMFNFIIQYVIQAFSFCLFWLLFPKFGFIIFFLVACLHFGFDWQTYTHYLTSFIFGYSILAISFYAHPNISTQLTHILLPPLSSHLLHSISSLVPITIMMGIWVCVNQNDIHTLLSWSAFLLLGLFFTPLVFFTIYFCGYHSIKHIKHMRSYLQPIANSDGMALIIWLISVIGLGCAYIIFFKNIHIHPLMTYFMILAGLTMPHMWLHLPKFNKLA